MLRLQKLYLEQIAPQLMQQLQYESVMQVPRLDKVVINMGVGDATSDVKKLERAVEEITQITGQKPVVTKSKKSIATFKLRQDQGIGVKVTLRNDRMWAFVDKLFTVALPRVRDFRGTTVNAFDGRGNYTLGVKEQIIFAEVDYDKVQKIRGFDVTFVTSTNDDEAARALLTMLGMPFGRAAPTVSAAAKEEARLISAEALKEELLKREQEAAAAAEEALKNPPPAEPAAPEGEKKDDHGKKDDDKHKDNDKHKEAAPAKQKEDKSE